MHEKQRVFVSSVVDGFGQFREAARAAIIAAGGAPVLVNEDLPALATSSRNACLDVIDSCDYFISIIGSRGGWTAPSGKLVVEEEYEHARARKKPVLAFLQTVQRDADATRFAEHLSDYVDGVFRRSFSTVGELQAEITQALSALIDEAQESMNMPHHQRDYFDDPYIVPNMAMLRFVLLPERQEEVVDPMRLGSDSFRNLVYEIGHLASVNLLSYERPKTADIFGDDLVITQTESNGRHGEGQHVRIQITGVGEIVIDANVTGRVSRRPSYSISSSMVVAAEDIEAVLVLCFAFTAAFYDRIDPHKRHQRFAFNAGLSGLAYRTIVRNPEARSSCQMSMRDNKTILAFDESRVVDRNDLSSPSGDVQRALTLLTRRSQA